MQGAQTMPLFFFFFFCLGFNLRENKLRMSFSVNKTTRVTLSKAARAARFISSPCHHPHGVPGAYAYRRRPTCVWSRLARASHTSCFSLLISPLPKHQPI